MGYDETNVFIKNSKTTQFLCSKRRLHLLCCSKIHTYFAVTKQLQTNQMEKSLIKQEKKNLLLIRFNFVRKITLS